MEEMLMQKMLMPKIWCAIFGTVIIIENCIASNQYFIKNPKEYWGMSSWSISKEMVLIRANHVNLDINILKKLPMIEFEEQLNEYHFKYDYNTVCNKSKRQIDIQCIGRSVKLLGIDFINEMYRTLYANITCSHLFGGNKHIESVKRILSKLEKYVM